MNGYLLHANPGVHSTASVHADRLVRHRRYRRASTSDDFVHIRGRVKRFAKIAGEMISLEVVERIAAKAAPGFAARGLDPPRRGQRRGDRAVHDRSPSLRREQLSAAARCLRCAPELAVPRVIRR